MSPDNPKGNAVRQNNPALKRKRKQQALTSLLAACTLLIAFAFISHQLLYAQSHDRASSEFAGKIPTVSVVHPEPVGGVSLEEPGYTMAYTEAPSEDQATVAVEEANSDQLNALEAFKSLRAPFDGIVTTRNIDVGTYVANGSGNQLFVVARISPLRIYAQIPQAYAPVVKIGMEAAVTLPQLPGRIFQAHVTNTSV